MKYRLDEIIRVKMELSIKFNLSKLNILEIFILLDMVYKIISNLF